MNNLVLASKSAPHNARMKEEQQFANDDFCRPFSQNCKLALICDFYSWLSQVNLNLYHMLVMHALLRLYTSLIRIVKDLLKDSALTEQYIPNARFNTDPLENFLTGFAKVVDGVATPAPRQCKKLQMLLDCKHHRKKDHFPWWFSNGKLVLPTMCFHIYTMMWSCNTDWYRELDKTHNINTCSFSCKVHSAVLKHSAVSGISHAVIILTHAVSFMHFTCCKLHKTLPLTRSAFYALHML